MATTKAGKGKRTRGGEPRKTSRLLGAREGGKKARQNAFLAVYSETGNLTAAAQAAGVTRRQHYEWAEDPEYRKAFNDAQEQATDALEAEARRRAYQGVEEPTGWYQGSPGGYVTRYSDTLLIFLLKGMRPDRYKERSQVETVDADFSDWTAETDLPFIQRLAEGEPFSKVAADRARFLAGAK